jgi:His/Glu/Gln/Arg/opine family amino acid ABC transporter permease subunit
VGLSDLNLRVLIPYLPMLGLGALRTLEVNALAIALSFPLGLVGALMRLSDNRLARSIATVYVEVVRNIPLLVVLYILFLVLPLYGIPINALTAGVLGLAINSTAFTIEIVRAGFAAIPPGQYEAARSLGLHRLQMLRLVIVPQVFRIVLPTLGNQIVAVAFGYFVICFSLSQLGRYLEHRTTRDLRPATEPTRGAIVRPLVSERTETQAAAVRLAP